MDILSALTLGKAKTTEDFAGLAAAERALTDDDLTAIGTDFKADEDKLGETLIRGCFREAWIEGLRFGVWRYCVCSCEG